MHGIRYGFIFIIICSLTGCGPIHQTAQTKYTLQEVNTTSHTNARCHCSILVSTPEAIEAYQTTDMLYVNKPYTLETFAYNAWSSPPASMLYSLVLQNLQKLRYFDAVASMPYAQPTTYRLDLQLLNLQQNFINKPSAVELTVKAVLTQVDESKVVASNIFYERVPSGSDTPYGGVVAANRAAQNFCNKLNRFLIANTQSK